MTNKKKPTTTKKPKMKLNPINMLAEKEVDLKAESTTVGGRNLDGVSRDDAMGIIDPTTIIHKSPLIGFIKRHEEAYLQRINNMMIIPGQLKEIEMYFDAKGFTYDKPMNTFTSEHQKTEYTTHYLDYMKLLSTQKNIPTELAELRRVIKQYNAILSSNFGLSSKIKSIFRFLIS